MKWNAEEGPDAEMTAVLNGIAERCWTAVGTEARELAAGNDLLAKNLAIAALTMALANELAFTALSREALTRLLDWTNRSLAKGATIAFAMNKETDHARAN